MTERNDVDDRELFPLCTQCVSKRTINPSTAFSHSSSCLHVPSLDHTTTHTLSTNGKLAETKALSRDDSTAHSAKHCVSEKDDREAERHKRCQAAVKSPLIWSPMKIGNP